MTTLALYEVDLSQILVENELNRNLLQSLVGISNNTLNEDSLRSMSANPRNCLYVLTEPVRFWGVNIDRPTIYWALQVYFEGVIPNMPTDEELGNAVSRTFPCYPPLPKESLVGVRIVNFFNTGEAFQETIDLAALNILTRFYDGEMVINTIQEAPLINLQKRWSRLHYFGIYINLMVDDICRWERYLFSLFFAGMLSNPLDPNDSICVCVMIRLLHDYQSVVQDETCSSSNIAKYFRLKFIRQPHLWDDLLALRIIKSYNALILQEDPHVRNLWNKLDEKLVEAFVKDPQKNFELILHLVQKLAEVYFSGRLPIDLEGDEELLLLLIGLKANEFDPIVAKLNTTAASVKSTLSFIFAKAVDFFNTLSPEKKKQKN